MKSLVLALIALLPTVAMTSRAGSLTGKVMEDTTGALIADAFVTVHVLLPDSIALPDTSDSSGLYAIEDIPPANEIYVITAWKPGYRQFYFRYDQLGSESVQFDIVLQRESFVPPGGGGDSTPVAGRIYGRKGVTGALSPLEGAQVRMVSPGVERLAWTDAAGRYAISVPGGSYAITVSASGYTASGSNGVRVQSEGLSYGIILREQPTAVSDALDRRDGFALGEAYPNPFNPATVITYQVAAGSDVRLAVYDVLGREVAVLVNERKEAGLHRVMLDARLPGLAASALPSGVYVYRLEAGDFVRSKKLILLK